MPAPSDPAEPDTPRFSGPGALDRALDLVRFLRGHCPWDARQTPDSLVPHLLEETHEVVDAIRAGDPDALEGELGDLLLNLAFQVVLAEESGQSDAARVYARLERKMVRRHPHLFGDGEARPWEETKARERGGDAGALDGLARGLDPLTAAYRMQDRAAGVGFDWGDWRGPLEKVREEIDELAAALEARGEGAGPTSSAGVAPDGAHGHGEPDGTEGSAGAAPAHPDPVDEELGDLLFAVVNLARLAGRHPHGALDRANRKFQRRFEALERRARERGLRMPGASLEALDALWDEVKAAER